MLSKTGNGTKNEDSNFEEHSRYPQQTTEEHKTPYVILEFVEGVTIKVKIDEIRKDGFLGSTPHIENIIGMDSIDIKQMEIHKLNEKPVIAKGSIESLWPEHRKNIWCLRVAFDKNLNGPDSGKKTSPENVNGPINIIPEKPYKVTNNPERKKEPKTYTDKDLLDLISSFEKYVDLKDPEKEAKLRIKALKKYKNVINGLSLDERWDFYELLEYMKEKEPDYPEEAVKNYIKLCRTGLSNAKD